MNKRGHQVGCIILSVISIYTKQYILIPGIIAGSFLPDLDCRSGSYIRSKLPLLGKLYNLLPKNKLFGRDGYNHRSLLLHSIYTILVLALISYIFDSGLIFGLFIGWLGHLILDRGGNK